MSVILVFGSLSTFAGSSIDVNKITGSYSLLSGSEQCPSQLEIYTDNGYISFNVSHRSILLDSINDGYKSRLEYDLLTKYCYKAKLTKGDTKLSVFRGDGFSGVPCMLLSKKEHVIELNEKTKTMKYYYDGVGIYGDIVINCQYSKLD